MRYETIGTLRLPKIGFGTWQIGGRTRPEPAEDARSLAALRSALQIGYTHFDTAEMYAGGHAEELLGQALRAAGVARQQVFITSKVKPEHLGYRPALRACAASLRRLGTDYIDLYLIHWPRAGMNLKLAFRALNQLVREGLVRHLGVSNFDQALLGQAAALSDTPLVTNQVAYSLSERTCAASGLLDYCRRHGILLTAYTPIQPGRFRITPAVQALADERGVSPYQIGLAWLVQQPGVITIPMSFDPQHQAENLAAADIQLSANEMERLSA